MFCCCCFLFVCLLLFFCCFFGFFVVVFFVVVVFVFLCVFLGGGILFLYFCILGEGPFLLLLFVRNWVDEDTVFLSHKWAAHHPIPQLLWFISQVICCSIYIHDVYVDWNVQYISYSSKYTLKRIEILWILDLFFMWLTVNVMCLNPCSYMTIHSLTRYWVDCG